MRKRMIVAAGGVAVLAAVVAGGVAIAGETEVGEQGSQDYTEQEARDATDAALDATGGGTVNSVERDSENGATWEVEVTEPDGDVVDVRLDENYEVVVIEGDSEDEPGDEGDD